MRDTAVTFGVLVGAVYLLIGVVGFFVTGFEGWVATNTGETLLWFELNPLHNVVHLAIGAALLAGSARPSSANVIAGVVGATYALVGIVGFWAVGEAWNILSLNHPDNWLHVGTAVVALLAISASQNRGRALTSRETAETGRL